MFDLLSDSGNQGLLSANIFWQPDRSALSQAPQSHSTLYRQPKRF
jgi:hypothetical protein